MWITESYHKTILGLSSPEVVSGYLRVLPEHDNLILVNYEPTDDSINCNSLVGMFDILLHRNIIPTFIDADFCKSIKSCGDDLVYIYNKCKKLNRDITISFTFSVRGVGLFNTLKWLKQQFGVDINNFVGSPILKEYWKYRQFVNKYGDCFHYRDSGDQMITGTIKIRRNENNL